MAVSLNILAETFLPAKLYQRLEASSIAKRLAHGSLWSLFGGGVSRVLVLVSMLLVARILGQVSFGEFGMIYATLGVVGLLAGVGLGSTATRFVAQYIVCDPIRAGRVIALVTSASIASVILASGILIAVSGFLASTVLDAPHLQVALIWGVLLMAITAFRGIQSCIFAGLGKFDIIAKLNILDGALSLIFIVGFAYFMGVEGGLLGLALSSIVVWLVGRILLMNELRTKSIIVRFMGCWNDWRILISYSLPNFLANIIATPVLWYTMTLMAQSEHGFAEIGIYSAAYQWHGPMIFMSMIFMTVSMPVLVQEWEAGRRESFRKVTFWIYALMLALSIPPAAIAAFLSPWIMEFYGPGFREGWMVLVLLLAAAPLHALAKISSGALFGMKRPWWVLGVNLLWSMTMIILAAWLIPTMGAMGLSIAFLAAYGILATFSFSLVLVGSKTIPSLHITN